MACGGDYKLLIEDDHTFINSYKTRLMCNGHRRSLREKKQFSVILLKLGVWGVWGQGGVCNVPWGDENGGHFCGLYMT